MSSSFIQNSHSILYLITTYLNLPKRNYIWCRLKFQQCSQYMHRLRNLFLFQCFPLCLQCSLILLFHSSNKLAHCKSTYRNFSLFERCKALHISTLPSWLQPQPCSSFFLLQWQLTSLLPCKCDLPYISCQAIQCLLYCKHSLVGKVEG